MKIFRSAIAAAIPLFWAAALSAQSNASPTFEPQRQTGIDQIKTGKFDAAIATFQRILREAPNDQAKADLWSHTGEAYRYKGDLAGSIKAYEQAFQLHQDTSTAATLGLLYEAGRDSAQARQYYEKAIAIDPNNAAALNNLAFLLAETGGDLDLALSYAHTAQEKFPNVLEIRDTVGWIYLKKKMITEAIGVFKVLAEAAPANPDFHYHYALALYQQDNLAEAIGECQVALSNKPNPKIEADIHALIYKITPQANTPR